MECTAPREALACVRVYIRVSIALNRFESMSICEQVSPTVTMSGFFYHHHQRNIVALINDDDDEADKKDDDAVCVCSVLVCFLLLSSLGAGIVPRKRRRCVQ